MKKLVGVLAAAALLAAPAYAQSSSYDQNPSQTSAPSGLGGSDTGTQSGSWTNQGMGQGGSSTSGSDGTAGTRGTSEASGSTGTPDEARGSTGGTGGAGTSGTSCPGAGDAGMGGYENGNTGAAPSTAPMNDSSILKNEGQGGTGAPGGAGTGLNQGPNRGGPVGTDSRSNFDTGNPSRIQDTVPETQPGPANPLPGGGS